MIETISYRTSHDEEISCLQENYKLLADANPGAMAEVAVVAEHLISPMHVRIDVPPDYKEIVSALDRTYGRLALETNIRTVRAAVGDLTPPTAIIYCQEHFLPTLFSSMPMMGGDVIWQIRVCKEMERPNSLYVALPDIISPEPLSLDFVIGRVDVDLDDPAPTLA